MAHASLKGFRVAILATNGFEQSELLVPRAALDAEGASTEVISPQGGAIKGWNHQDWGQTVEVDGTLDDVDAGDYDALLLPGGVMNPDSLRVNANAVAFIRDFSDAQKPIAAICHGPWSLVEAGIVNGHKMTSWPSLKTDIRNAGGDWVDESVVVDGNLITSRKPDDLPAFNREILRLFGHAAQRRGEVAS